MRLASRARSLPPVLRRVLWAVLLLAGCGAGDGNGASPVTVFAASSLTEAFGDLEQHLDDLTVTYNFAGSQALVQQIVTGAPADVVATADERTMAQLVEAELVERPVVFASNRLVIAVEAGNPLGVTGLVDLARPELAVVLADPSVPSGRYAAEALAAAGVTVRPRSLELDVRAALAKVVNGEADAAIVYATDARVARTRTDAIPSAGAEAVYLVAVVRNTEHRAAAEAFVARITSGPGRAVLRARGFELP